MSDSRSFAIVIGIGLYLVTVGLLVRLAEERNIRDAWWAYIPPLSLVLMCDLARVTRWWVAVCFVPIFGGLVAPFLWYRIAKSITGSGWIGLLACIPGVHFVLLWHFIKVAKLQNSVGSLPAK